MKTLILTLLFTLSLPVLAKSESPNGLFQVHSSHSSVTLSGESQALSGFIEIKEEFPASSFRLEAGNSLFESQMVSGDLSNFEVKGIVTVNGEKKELILTGSYFGSIEQEDGVEKIVMKLASEDCVSSVIATKPKLAVTELHRAVREIFR